MQRQCAERDVYGPAIEEMARRAKFARSHDPSEISYFPSDASPRHEHVARDQRVALVSCGTAVLAPRPLDATRPTLRVYGAFANKAEALEHAQVVQSLDPRSSLMTVDVDEWLLLPRTTEHRDDATARSRRVADILREREATRERASQAFEARRGKAHVEDDGVTVATRDEEVRSRAEDDDDRDVYGAPRRIRSGAEVRGQSTVALCVVPRDDGECLFRILGCFETTEEANEWVRSVATRRIVHEDVFVGRTCEWLYPNARQMDRLVYRVDELQRIMDTAADNPGRVQRYQDWLDADAEKAKVE